MKIALVGKFSNLWGAEHSVQRGFWALGHKVSTIELTPERDADYIRYGPEWPHDSEDYDYYPSVYNESARSLRCVDLTVVMQGYGMLPETIRHIQQQTGNPVVLWHGEVLGDHWPTDDHVVQAKVAHLQQNLSAYDLVCHNCSTSLEVLRILGAKQVAWVPTNGIDPRIQQRLSVKKDFDIGIYGWASERRVAIVQEVISHVQQDREPPLIVAWPDASTHGVYGDVLTEYINRCRMILNIHFSQTLNVENRLYEALGCGVPVVSEPVSYLFPVEVGVSYGHSPKTLAQAIQTIMDLPQATYLDLCDAGAQWVAPYTYQARCAQLLDAIEKALG